MIRYIVFGLTISFAYELMCSFCRKRTGKVHFNQLKVLLASFVSNTEFIWYAHGRWDGKCCELGKDFLSYHWQMGWYANVMFLKDTHTHTHSHFLFWLWHPFVLFMNSFLKSSLILAKRICNWLGVWHLQHGVILSIVFFPVYTF